MTMKGKKLRDHLSRMSLKHFLINEDNGFNVVSVRITTICVKCEYSEETIAQLRSFLNSWLNQCA